MSETKFTPGPWVVTEERSRNESPRFVIRNTVPIHQDAFGLTTWVAQGGYAEPVLDVPEAQAIVEARRADAHLIAAAPDLYAALKGLFEHCFLNSDSPDYLVPDEHREPFDKTRAALAKARGED